MIIIVLKYSLIKIYLIYLNKIKIYFLSTNKFYAAHILRLQKTYGTLM